MKKTFTYLFAVALLVMGSYGTMNADTYKKYHINQTFDGLDALPTGWSFETTNANGTKAVYGRSGSVALDAGGFIKTTCGANSGGTRGGELAFPSTASSTTITGHTTFIVEMDWTVNTAEVTAKNAVGLIFLGSHSSGIVKDNSGEDAYPDAIFGLYATGSGDVLHYWNMDLTGPIDETIATPAPYGPVFLDFGSFRRAGADAAAVDAINASTATTVPFAKGNTYHIYAELDFANHKVVALTITNKDIPGDTQTILDKPFISDKVEDGNHYPNDLAQVSTVCSRGNNTGTNGNTVNLEVYYDNLQVYVNEISLGRTDVTIKRVDQTGTTIDTRTATAQEISTEYFALASDKASFTDGGNYYAYNEWATLDNGGSESVIVATGAEIVLKFKKTPVTSGLYTWTGTSTFYWDEVDNNFSVNGASAIGYQSGNAVAFSNAAAQNKLITLQKPMNLGEGDLMITADGYELSGEGKLTGTGGIVINPGNEGTATIGVLNQLERGITVTSGTAHIKSATAANQITVANNAKLLLEAGANFSTPINGEGGAITIATLSNNQYNTSVSNVSTVNLVLGQTGRISSDYSSKWTGSFPDGTQVNVTQNIDTIARFAVNTNIQNAKVNLGDKTSLVRHYNENNTGTDTLFVGELNGTAGSFIEGGFVGGRKVTYTFGGLNTNAEFAGEIKKYQYSADSVVVSDLMIHKIGTGIWTLSGNSPEYSGSLIEVREGTLAIGGTLGQATNTTAVNVRAGATLKGNGGNLGAFITTVYNGATLAGDLTIENILYVEPDVTIKLHVADFTNYDVLKVTGDVTFDGDAILDITVNNSTVGAKAKLFDFTDLSVLESAFAQILVNGEDITANTTATAGAKFVWLPATGELLSQTTITDIATVAIAKEVQSVRYYNLTGIQVAKDTEGIVIVKTTYTDGTSSVVKVLNPYNRK
ncbi:hypothetical protein FACS1894176_03160 [Bacteroidia bacterium]|nr:hypothetical protein FACS1894176_03160 [Bacteroidia bacterium]